MSIQAVAWALQQKISSPGQKLTLISLANHADPSGRSCFPSQKLIAAETSLSVKTLQRHLAALEEAEFIGRGRRNRSDGTRTSDAYWLQIGAESADSLGDKMTPGQGDNIDEPRRQNDAPTEPVVSNRQEEEELESCGLSSETNDSNDLVATIIEAYHEHCPSLTDVREITVPRRRSALARYRDLGNSLAGWEAFCDHIEASDFLSGRKTDFVAGFDWIIKKANYVKIMEGRYVNRQKAQQINSYQEITERVRANVAAGIDPGAS